MSEIESLRIQLASSQEAEAMNLKRCTELKSSLDMEGVRVKEAH